MPIFHKVNNNAICENDDWCYQDKQRPEETYVNIVRIILRGFIFRYRQEPELFPFYPLYNLRLTLYSTYFLKAMIFRAEV